MPPPWQPYQQAEAALQRVERDLAAAPNDTPLLFERARLLDRLARPDMARQAYLAVLARDFRHEAALIALGALLFAQKYTSAARTTFERAIAINPANLEARLHLGNLLRLAEQPDPARAEYEAALRIDPACREAHQGLAYVLEDIDPALADHHRQSGFAGTGVITTPYRGQNDPITVLRIVSAHGGNIPLAEVLDDRIFLIHTLIAEFADPAVDLPPHDVVFNAIGDVGRCAPALRGLPKLLSRTSAPVINDPARVLATSRDSTNLRGVPGAILPVCREVPKGVLQVGPPPGFAFPFLLRSPGFHTGQHFRPVYGVDDLQEALELLPGDTLTRSNTSTHNPATGCSANTGSC
jgi:tetratricopeptide (TPR) repeat protein